MDFVGLLALSFTSGPPPPSPSDPGLVTVSDFNRYSVQVEDDE